MRLKENRTSFRVEYCSLALVVLLATGCSSSDDEDTTSLPADTDESTEESPALTAARETIVGGWFFEIPDVDCRETYIFDEGNTFSETSLNEVVSGTYILTYDETTDNVLLDLIALEDNELEDCGAEIDDDVEAGGFSAVVEFVDTNTMRNYSGH